MGNEQGSVLNREPIKSPCKVSWDTISSCDAQGREGHSAASVDNKVYVYGGSGLTHLFELSVYDTGENSWRDVQCFGEKPGPLCNATLSAIGTKLYLFGGLNRETGWNNDIWSFDTASEKWEKLATKGTPPSPRDKHTAVVWGSKVVVFGGFGPAVSTEEENMTESDSEDEGESIKFTWYNDIYMFDSATKCWEAPAVSLVGGPVARAAHSAALYQDRMIIFGGKDSRARNQDLFVLDLTTLEWSTFQDAGARPAPSSFHCAVQYEQFMITFGGRFNDNTHSNQLNVLDCETGGWYNPIEGAHLPAEGTEPPVSVTDPQTASETKPSSRGQCILSVVEDGKLVMFGGSDRFDMLQQCCQEFDTGVYSLDCKLLKSVEVPPPTEDAMDEDTDTATATAPSDMGNIATPPVASDMGNIVTDKQTKEQTIEHNNLLDGV